MDSKNQKIPATLGSNVAMMVKTRGIFGIFAILWHVFVINSFFV